MCWSVVWVSCHLSQIWLQIGSVLFIFTSLCPDIPKTRKQTPLELFMWSSECLRCSYCSDAEKTLNSTFCGIASPLRIRSVTTGHSIFIEVRLGICMDWPIYHQVLMNSSMGVTYLHNLEKLLGFLSTNVIGMKTLSQLFLELHGVWVGWTSAVYAPVDSGLVLVCDSRDQILAHNGNWQINDAAIQSVEWKSGYLLSYIILFFSQCLKWDNCSFLAFWFTEQVG